MAEEAMGHVEAMEIDGGDVTRHDDVVTPQCQRCGSTRIVITTPAQPGPNIWGHRCKVCGYTRDISAEVRAEIDAEYPDDVIDRELAALPLSLRMPILRECVICGDITSNVNRVCGACWEEIDQELFGSGVVKE